MHPNLRARLKTRPPFYLSDFGPNVGRTATRAEIMRLIEPWERAAFPDELKKKGRYFPTCRPGVALALAFNRAAFAQN